MQPYMGKKQVEGIPDAYGVTISVFGGKPEKYEIIDHGVCDKVYERVPTEGGFTLRCVGVHASPFWEFYLQENNELFCVPVGSSTVKFDIRWWELCEKRKLKDAQAQTPTVLEAK